MTSPRLPLVKAQRSFLSGIRLSIEQHGPKVKVTAPPKKNGSSELENTVKVQTSLNERDDLKQKLKIFDLNIQ
jgi:hypothetical protein